MDKHILIACSSFNLDSDFVEDKRYIQIFNTIRNKIYKENVINIIYFDFMNVHVNFGSIPTRSEIMTIINDCKNINAIYSNTYNLLTSDIKNIIRMSELEMRYDLIILLGCGFIKNILTPEATMSYNYMTKENGIICICWYQYKDNEQLNVISVEYLLNFQLRPDYIEFMMTIEDEQLAAELFLSYFNPVVKNGIQLYVKDEIINKNTPIRKINRQPMIATKHSLLHKIHENGLLNTEFDELYKKQPPQEGGFIHKYIKYKNKYLHLKTHK